MRRVCVAWWYKCKMTQIRGVAMNCIERVDFMVEMVWAGHQQRQMSRRRKFWSVVNRSATRLVRALRRSCGPVKTRLAAIDKLEWSAPEGWPSCSLNCTYG